MFHDGEIPINPMFSYQKRAKLTNPRWTISSAQLTRLESLFKEVHTPSLAMRQQLAQEMGVTPRQIQVWFRNRRQRVRLAKLGGGPADGREGADVDGEGDAAAGGQTAKRARVSADGEEEDDGEEAVLEGADERDAASNAAKALPGGGGKPSPTHGRKAGDAVSISDAPASPNSSEVSTVPPSLAGPFGGPSAPGRIGTLADKDSAPNLSGSPPHLSLGESTHSSTHYSVSTHGGAAFAGSHSLPGSCHGGAQCASLARSASVHDGAPPAAPPPSAAAASQQARLAREQTVLGGVARGSGGAGGAPAHFLHAASGAAPAASPCRRHPGAAALQQASARRRLRGILSAAAAAHHHQAAAAAAAVRSAAAAYGAPGAYAPTANMPSAVARTISQLASSGLASHPAIANAIQSLVDDYGASASAGGLAPHNPPLAHASAMMTSGAAMPPPTLSSSLRGGAAATSGGRLRQQLDSALRHQAAAGMTAPAGSRAAAAAAAYDASMAASMAQHQQHAAAAAAHHQHHQQLVAARQQHQQMLLEELAQRQYAANAAFAAEHSATYLQRGIYSQQAIAAQHQTDVAPPPPRPPVAVGGGGAAGVAPEGFGAPPRAG